MKNKLRNKGPTSQKYPHLSKSKSKEKSKSKKNEPQTPYASSKSIFSLSRFSQCNKSQAKKIS